jgi:serine phosphatase RsbU (regulator of sigma subunit)
VTPDREQQELQIANVTSVAEAVQRAVLSPLPEQLGPLKLGVVYLAAAAEARVGGDLYEVTYTENHGIRLIIGDVRGKGLGAVEVAADIIGRFREVAHGVGTLNEVANRLDAGLSRRWGPYEEFVTALLAEIDVDRGKLTILNCGHPPPILVSPDDGSVTVLEVRAPAPPLGLLTLGSDAGAKEVYNFKPNDQLLLYTDGVTEARDASREFYPLDERVRALAPQAQPKLTRSGKIRLSGTAPSLLDLVRDDLLRYVGAPPDDDAALLLVRAPAAWPDTRPPAGLAAR